MPIKAFNTSQYEQVPDEDVTPINYNISRMVRRNDKTFRTVVAVTIGVLVIVGVAFTGYYLFDLSYENDIVIYETAAGPEFTSGLDVINLRDLKKTVPLLRSLTFGNNICDNEEKNGNDGSENPTLCTVLNGMGYIAINPDVEYQEILGFGGAFTEASAYHFYKLSPVLQKKVLELYFGEDGSHYSLGRIHINSCDFSVASYSFDEVVNDYELKYFDDNVTHDTYEIIPFIQEAMAMSPFPIRLVASPWSPPAWMKEPNPETGKSSMLGSVTPNGLKRDRNTQSTWANYLARFVSAYHAKGIPIWAITPQNEPEFPAPWEACSYNASFESAFINDYLGPTMRKLHPQVKILAFDHNKDHLEAWTKEILKIGRAHV